ncbi:MAG: phosphate/phosphite/phosphonate ABC transporter substrate-binding protein [Planctomycetes bacterium]|nr:phosphate/phosphite/phosphonate ABC transporter substrate-binding protein [Planctomycetota bacterium]
MNKPILVGAVLYEPKVSVIWDIIRDFFESNGCPMDVVFYTNYELQVEALLKGHIEIAWNSPLAWVDAQRQSGGKCRAIAMRDTDRDRVSHLVVASNSGINDIADLKGKTVAVGAKDSPQARLIPLGLLQRHGLTPGKDVTVRRFDVLVGKHGDHIGGELDAFKCLQAGEAQACAMLDMNWDRWSSDGTIDPSRFKILATTDRFDHCVFTVRENFDDDREAQWLKVLYSMSYDNPKHREMMDMEGLKKWEPGRTSGFGPLTEAVQKLQYFEGSEA